MRTAHSLPHSGLSAQDDLCPGGLSPGGLCLGGLCPGGLCLEISVRRIPLDRDPAEEHRIRDRDPPGRKILPDNQKWHHKETPSPLWIEWLTNRCKHITFPQQASRLAFEQSYRS